MRYRRENFEALIERIFLAIATSGNIMILLFIRFARSPGGDGSVAPLGHRGNRPVHLVSRCLARPLRPEQFEFTGFRKPRRLGAVERGQEGHATGSPPPPGPLLPPCAQTGSAPSATAKNSFLCSAGTWRGACLRTCL